MLNQTVGRDTHQKNTMEKSRTAPLASATFCLVRAVGVVGGGGGVVVAFFLRLLVFFLAILSMWRGGACVGLWVAAAVPLPPIYFV